MRAYLEYVRDESRRHFEAGRTSLRAAERVGFGPYGEWRAPARLFINVERAYREFRNEPPDAPWDTAATFEAIYEVATARGILAEFQSTFSIVNARASKWLGGRDSNPDSQIQSLESYRWTTPQRNTVPHRDRRGHLR
jgi:hypothetical protein